MDLNQIDCCGIREGIGIDYEDNYDIDGNDIKFTPKDVLEGLVHSARYDKRFAYIIFSSITKNGTKLAKYIRANRLGDITTLKARKNPNTDNILQVWLWAPTRAALTGRKRIVKRRREV